MYAIVVAKRAAQAVIAAVVKICNVCRVGDTLESDYRDRLRTAGRTENSEQDSSKGFIGHLFLVFVFMELT
ncbi:MAG: hypothetical protein EOO39_22490 [Cytophagaceae bacterium]|nr:MAG: hypothetical protein EOO39_22490 [Cytophagaceae bacterium]